MALSESQEYTLEGLFENVEKKKTRFKKLWGEDAVCLFMNDHHLKLSDVEITPLPPDQNRAEENVSYIVWYESPHELT